jgi:hypothetical protein
MSNTSKVPFPPEGRAGGGADTGLTPPVEQTIGGHGSHQGSPASWVLVAVVIAAFTAGGAAIIARLWPLFWVCVGITFLAIPVGKFIGIMDDTVVVDSWPEEQPPAADRGSVADPGVRI